MAPEGKSTFYALVPGGASGQAADRLGWRSARCLRRDTRRGRPPADPRHPGRIVTKFHYAPTDFAHDLNAHPRQRLQLEPILTQSAWFRGHNRDDVISQPLLRRRGHASRRGNSRGRRQRQGDGEADVRGSEMKRLAVYCGSATPADPAISKLARDCRRSRWRARHRRGLWRRAARPDGRGGRRGALEAGGEVIGVIPEALVNQRGRQPRMHRTACRPGHARTQKDVHRPIRRLPVTLPGGVGTMDELWEAISWAQLGYHAKPVGRAQRLRLLRHLIAFNRHMVDVGFIREHAS
jgi:predicted Rossmann-fold nucleotide-binding protein